MSKYFLHDGENQLGPFDKAELKEKKITIETPIWFEGLADWTTAGEISDLKDLFVIAPPPFRKADKAEATLAIPVNDENIKPENVPQPKNEDVKIENITKKKFKLGVLHYVIIGSILLIATVSFILYNKSQEKIEEAENQTAAVEQNLEQEKQKAEQERQRVALEQQKAEEERQRENTPEKLRERLLEKEQNSPTNYLSGSGTLEENITRHPDLFHHTETDGYVIKGYIINSATMARYKDAVILIRYFTKTKTLLGTKEFVINEYFNPRATTNFGPYKLYPPQGYAEWSMEIKNATSN